VSGDELPEGWTASGIEQLCHKITDGTHFSPKEQNRRGGYKYVTAKNIREWGLDLSDVTYVSEAIHRPIFQRCNPEKDDVLYIKDGATAGIAILNPLEEEFSLLSSVALLKPDRSQLDPSFLKWYLMSPVGRRAMLDQVTGSAITRLTLEIIRKSVIPVPPLAEQKRIVAKVEELLARVNAARERLARVPAILKRFRQAVLAAACEGRLTEEWRASMGPASAASVWRSIVEEEEPAAELPAGWAWRSVDEIATVSLGGTPSRKDANLWNGGVPWVSSGEVARSRISRTRETISRLGLERSNAKVLPKGSVLIAMIGEGKTRGQAAILDIEAATNQNVAGLVLREGVIPEYVWLWALGEYERHRGGGRGGNYPALNGAIVRAFILPVPSKAEQREIVRRVEALFKLADAIEKRVAAATARTGKVTQAILAKAFRGELVPTEAELARREGRAYEPESAPLGRVRGERAGADTKGDGRRRRASPEGAAKRARAQVRRGA
jgi:type I restriction enzyme S subunit